MGGLHFSIVDADKLSTPIVDTMWEIFCTYYTEVTRAQFEADLAGKSHVILLFTNEDDTLKGFSTLAHGIVEVDGRRTAFVFSGDTIVVKDFWGTNALQRAFFVYIATQKLKHLGMPLYWFLISKGYRTYLLLTRNFPEHWPRHDQPTPDWQKKLLHTLARARFGQDYDETRNIICHSRPLGRLKEDTAPIEERFLAEPDIRFFVQQNPGHARGEELCCLGRVDFNMLTFYLNKRLKKLWHRWFKKS